MWKGGNVKERHMFRTFLCISDKFHLWSLQSFTTMTSSYGNIFRVTGPLGGGGNPPITADSPHKGQWRGAWMFSLIYAWTNGRANNRDAGDLRHNLAHYDVTAMRYGFALPFTGRNRQWRITIHTQQLIAVNTAIELTSRGAPKYRIHWKITRNYIKLWKLHPGRRHVLQMIFQ